MTRSPRTTGDVSFGIRELSADDVGDCDGILTALPQWFGIPDVNAAYIASLTSRPCYVATDPDDGRVVGFVGIETHSTSSAEILVMGVDPQLHRSGIGAQLVHAVIVWCRANGVAWLHVKTRGPSTYDDDYEKTRQFYRAQGFEVLYESLTEWGAEDAALILVMTV